VGPGALAALPRGHRVPPTTAPWYPRTPQPDPRRPRHHRHHGIRVTTPVRTLCDIASRHTDDGLRKAIDDARVATYLTADGLDELLRRCPRAGRLAGAHATRSTLERDWRRFAARHNLPPHEINARVHGYEVDVHFPDHRLVVELDGWHFHRGPRSFRDDRLRDTVLKDHGLDTVRLTADRLTDPEGARLQRILVNQQG
jgi:very-short-patch-repair endonuclease